MESWKTFQHVPGTVTHWTGWISIRVWQALLVTATHCTLITLDLGNYWLVTYANYALHTPDLCPLCITYSWSVNNVCFYFWSLYSAHYLLWTPTLCVLLTCDPCSLYITPELCTMCNFTSDPCTLCGTYSGPLHSVLCVFLLLIPAIWALLTPDLLTMCISRPCTLIPALCVLCTSDPCSLCIIFSWPLYYVSFYFWSLHSVSYLLLTPAFLTLLTPDLCTMSIFIYDPYTLPGIHSLCFTLSWLLHFVLCPLVLCTPLRSCTFLFVSVTGFSRTEG